MWVLLLACVGCQAAARGLQGDEPTERMVLLDGAAPGWQARLVLDRDRVGIWRVEAAPVFPQYAAPEIVALDDEGTCWVLVSYSGKWTPFRVLADGAWLGALASGDLDPWAPGRETYVGGQLGRLYQVRSYADGGIDGRRIATFPGREIHSLAAGDFDPAHDGQELLVFTDPGGMYLLRSSASAGAFGAEFLGDLPGRIRDARVLPDGASVVTAGRDGAVSLLTFDASGPRWQIIHEIDEGRGRLALGTGARGASVLYSSADDGRVFRHVRLPDASWRTETIYHGPVGPRGLAAGRFGADPEAETVAVFGYSGRVELLEFDADGWNVSTLFTARDRGHWLAAAEFDGRNSHDELFLCGYGARVVMLAREPGSARAEAAVRPAEDSHARREER